MFYTYIMASQRNGTLYTGSTDDLPKRVFNHQRGAGSAFTARYNVTRLVWFESHETVTQPSGASARSRNGGGPGNSA